MELYTGTKYIQIMGNLSKPQAANFETLNGPHELHSTNSTPKLPKGEQEFSKSLILGRVIGLAPLLSFFGRIKIVIIVDPLGRISNYAGLQFFKNGPCGPMNCLAGFEAERSIQFCEGDPIIAGIEVGVVS